jgi:flagellar biosynthesis protein FlhG
MSCPLVVAVISGKGDVRETSASMNLAIAFSKMGKRVLLVDRAYEGAGAVPQPLSSGDHDLEDLPGGGFFAETQHSCEQPGILTLPLPSGITDHAGLTPEAKLSIFSCIERTSEKVDIVLIDTGPGSPGAALFLDSAAHHIVVTVSPEPASIAAALGFMKVMFKQYRENSFKVLVNRAGSEKEGLKTFSELSLKAERFSALSVDYLGCIIKDEYTRMAEITHRPVMELSAESSSGRSYMEVAGRMNELSARQVCKGGMQFFFREMLKAG